MIQIGMAPLKGSGRTSRLSGGRCARRGLREFRAGSERRILGKRQRRHRLQQDDRRERDELRRGLVAQVAVRAARVVVGALVIPVADYTSGEDQ